MADTADTGISQRGLLKTALAASAAVSFFEGVVEAGQQGAAPEDAGTLDRVWRQPGSGQRILLKGGTIVSMDPKVGDFVKGDVLIEGKKIVSVAAEIKAPRRRR